VMTLLAKTLIPMPSFRLSQILLTRLNQSKE
jgi:hypothetical protein